MRVKDSIILINMLVRILASMLFRITYEILVIIFTHDTKGSRPGIRFWALYDFTS